MQFDYDHCRSLLCRSVNDAISEHAEEIRSLEAKYRKDWCGGLWGLSLDVLPWWPMVTLSFRTSEDDKSEIRYSPPDWKGYQFIGGVNSEKSIAPALDYVDQMSKGVSDDPDRAQEMNHLIYLAAADALLDPSVAKLLQSCNAKASVIENQLPYREFAWFEYVVVDVDQVFKMNYCQLICANRVARRLVGKVIV
jgi:hypothetical protein